MRQNRKPIESLAVLVFTIGSPRVMFFPNQFSPLLYFGEAASSSSGCDMENSIIGGTVLDQFEECSGISSSEIEKLYDAADSSSSTESSIREALLLKANECAETPANDAEGSYGGERDICVAG